MDYDAFTSEFIQHETVKTELSMESSVSFFLCKFKTVFGEYPAQKLLGEVKARIFDEILRRRKECPETCCNRCTQPTSPIHMFPFYGDNLCYRCFMVVNAVVYDYKAANKSAASLNGQELLNKAWEWKYGSTN